MKQLEKENNKKKTDKLCFWVVVKKKGLFVKMAFFRKIGKHDLCSEGPKNAHFRCNDLFLENGPFFDAHSKSPNTTKTGGIQQAQGKTQNGTSGCKSAIFGRGLERGVYYL